MGVARAGGGEFDLAKQVGFADGFDQSELASQLGTRGPGALGRVRQLVTQDGGQKVVVRFPDEGLGAGLPRRSRRSVPALDVGMDGPQSEESQGGLQ